MTKKSLNRKAAAEYLSVSVDMLKEAQYSGRLKAKNTKFDKDGRAVGITLYDVSELERWFDSLGDA